MRVHIYGLESIKQGHSRIAKARNTPQNPRVGLDPTYVGSNLSTNGKSGEFPTFAIEVKHSGLIKPFLQYMSG